MSGPWSAGADGSKARSRARSAADDDMANRRDARDPNAARNSIASYDSADGAGRPCAQCGADLTFDPDLGLLACAYCGHRQPPPDTPAGALRELDYAEALGDAMRGAELETQRVVSCDSCGARSVMPPTLEAARCAFCAAPLLAEVRDHRQFRPQAILPFAISEDKARARLARWLGSRWFAPGDLKTRASRSGGLRGVYLPFWTFDAAATVEYAGMRGDVHHVTRWATVRRNGKTRRIRKRVPEIRWSPRRGRFAHAFDDVLALASKSLPDRLARRLADARAFDLQAMAPHSRDYLAGFEAEVYQVDLEEGYAAARSVMDLVLRREARLAIGGDRQKITRLDAVYDDVAFKHVLLPVWIAAYRYRGRVYRYIVNGRTGAVIGERPWSAWRVGLAAAGAAGVAALVFLALAAFD